MKLHTEMSNDHDGRQEVIRVFSEMEPMIIYIITITSVFIILIIGMALLWLKTYRSLIRTIRSLQKFTPSKAGPEEKSFAPDQNFTVKLEANSLSISTPQQHSTKLSSRCSWRTTQKSCRFNRADLNLHQLIKAGREGVFYKAKMVHGTIKGHSMFTCKITRKGCRQRQVEKEVSVMQKLGTHKNLLQLLDWDITNNPYMLVMEYVAHGTLRSFLQVNKDRLSKDKDLQHLFTIAAYHIAHAMEHLRSKMIMHCDLALRNIMVHSFPHEVKVAEFGLAKETHCTLSRNNRRNKESKFQAVPLQERIPFRWYPPEYFKNDYYGFKGDVWAFGIVIWEMQTFGTLPYPDLKTSEEVACYVCAGHRNTQPEQCRPEMLQMMQDCWQEHYSLRPSFLDVVRVLENILESDCDYVDVTCDDQNVSDESANLHPIVQTEVYCNTNELK